MILLSIIGLIAAVWVWQNVNPIAGLVVGFLFVGGLGWKGIGFLIGNLRPSARKAYGPEGREFIAAWETRFGPLHPGGTNHPPAGVFQRWLKAKNSTGIAAGKWIDQQILPPPAPDVISQLQSAPPSPSTAPPTLIGYCRVLTDPTADASFPARMVVDADEHGLSVSARSTDPFFDLEWDDLERWEPSTSPESQEPAWLLHLRRDSESAPAGVVGLKVYDIAENDMETWTEYLALVKGTDQA